MATSRKGILAGMYGSGSDVAKQVAADTSLPSAGFQDPPPGIKDGRGQLDEIKVDVYKSGNNEGKPYFAFVGIIVAPVEHTYVPTSQGKSAGDPVTVQVADMQTRLQFGIHDKKINSGPNMGKIVGWQEAVKEVGAQFRGLGFDTSKVNTLQDLEDLAERATKIARDPKTPIYFKFSTSVRKSQNAGELDGAWQNWHGLAPDDYEPPTRDEVPVDNSGEAEAPADDSTGSDDNDVKTMSLDALLAAAKAEGDDESEAQDELLSRAAEKSGKTEDEVRELPDVDLDMLYKLASGEEAGDEPEEKAPPKKGEHFNYKPMVKGIGGKPAKKANKAIEVSVTSVNTKAKTATVKNTTDGKTEYRDIPWSDLEDIS